jgi:hypothetical protein
MSEGTPTRKRHAEGELAKENESTTQTNSEPTQSEGWETASPADVANRRIVRPLRTEQKIESSTEQDSTKPLSFISSGSALSFSTVSSETPTPLSFNFDFPTSLAASWTSLGSLVSKSTTDGVEGSSKASEQKQDGKTGDSTTSAPLSFGGISSSLFPSVDSGSASSSLFSTESLFSSLSSPALSSSGFTLLADSSPSFNFSIPQTAQTTQLYTPPAASPLEVSLPQQPVEQFTGEEDEKRLLTLRAKLFKLEGETWKERGIGPLHVNSSASRARLVMRNEGVLKLILNTPILPTMAVQRVQEKGVRIAALDDGTPASFLLRLSRRDEADRLFRLLESLSNSANKGGQLSIGEDQAEPEAPEAESEKPLVQSRRQPEEAGHKTATEETAAAAGGDSQAKEEGQSQTTDGTPPPATDHSGEDLQKPEDKVAA